MALNEWEQRVVNRIDELKDELVLLCQDLIRIPSWDRQTRGEAEVAHRVGKTLETHDIHPEYFASHPNIDNLVATWGAEKGPRRLLFNGHSDVIPPGEDWTVDPFTAEIREEFIYGRGAVDMKGGISSMTMAVCALRDLDVPIQGSLIVNVVGDEERQGQLGTTWCIDNIWEKIRADGAIISEPSGLGGFGPTVCFGEKGPAWVKVTMKGEKAHGSVPSIGKNAIERMLQLLRALRETQPPRVPPPLSQDELVQEFAAAVGVEPHVMKALIERGGKSSPITAGIEAMTKTTMNIGTIQGGVAPNVVPDRCEAQIDFRILPGQKPQEMIDFIASMAVDLGYSEYCRVELVEAFEGTSTPNFRQDPLLITLFGSVRELVGPTIFFMVPFASDGRLLRKAGLTSTAVYGPGNLTLAHTADEKVAIADLLNATKVFAISALRYLGVKE